MKPNLIFPALFISLSFLLAGCGFGDAADVAAKQADKYHKFLQAGNENAMLNMVHEDGIAHDEEGFRGLMHKMATETNITKVEKQMGFNTSINNGITTVRLNYTLHDKNHGKITEEIVLQDSKEGVMKIIALNYK
ncbi:MAG: hypothetical protein ACFHU9_12575 [Fluviicola sp.]